MRILHSNLLAKLSLVLLCTVGLGFAVFTLVQTRRQVATLSSSQERMATALARGVSAGLRHSMLTGNALTVERLLDDTRAQIPGADIHVYSVAGNRVFEPHNPMPKGYVVPDFVEQALRSELPTSLPEDTDMALLQNQERCKVCHEDGSIRGILALNVKDARLRVTNPDVGGRAVAEVIRAAFVQLMTSEHENGLNPLFDELTKTIPEIRSVSVLSIAGAVSYGDPSLVAPSLQEKVLQQKSPLSQPQGDSILWALPLANEARCQNCHTQNPDMRGTLLVAVDSKLTAKTLTQATKTSLDHVMLAGLGRLITSFLDDAASSGGMTSLSLYDPAGQLYHTTQSSMSGASLLVERALNEHTALLGRLSDPKRPLLSYVEPLVNDQACQRCHGNARPIRGAIEVTLDRTQEREEQRILLFRGSMTALGTMLVVIFALYLGLRRTVLNPVLEIGAVADRVGAGDLEHEAPVRSGDEIGRLAVRINDMIGGLRKKIELSKFVSQETVRTIDAQDGAIDRIGKRRQMTMLFSDIRGFTAYSEKHEPEEVVEMLNQYLSVQADVVERHGGDIDKYVGDELMARFSGDGMEARAIRCGVEMIEAVASLSKQHGVGEALGVGIGINAGDVVIGAMGSKERMDFTVIGDAVNVAARLCSAAKPGQVLIAANTAAKASLNGINLETLAPLTLKGKSEPLKVFQATRIDVTG